MHENDPTKTIKAVETSFTIIEVLKNMQQARVSEIAEKIDMPISTAYIHLNTLVKLGYVIKRDNKYKISLKFLEHGGAVRHQMDFFNIIKDEVNQIADHTGEIAGFGIEERGKRVILYRNEGDSAVGDQTPVGEHTDLHWTSLGKAIMAHLPKWRIDEIVNRHGLPKGTRHTITKREKLMSEFAIIRKSGYAIDNAEHRRGIRGIAVPITDESSNIVGSLGITGPKTRFDKEYMAEILDILLKRRNIIEIQNEFYK